MKKKLGMLLAVLLTFCMTVGVFADAGKTQQVDYKTDYYMIVESPDGGVDMYSEADTSSPKLNDELIPNGTAIHVEGESTDEVGKNAGACENCQQRPEHTHDRRVKVEIIGKTCAHAADLLVVAGFAKTFLFVHDVSPFPAAKGSHDESITSIYSISHFAPL